MLRLSLLSLAFIASFNCWAVFQPLEFKGFYLNGDKNSFGFLFPSFNQQWIVTKDGESNGTKFYTILIYSASGLQNDLIGSISITIPANLALQQQNSGTIHTDISSAGALLLHQAITNPNNALYNAPYERVDSSHKRIFQHCRNPKSSTCRLELERGSVLDRNEYQLYRKRIIHRASNINHSEVAVVVNFQFVVFVNHIMNHIPSPSLSAQFQAAMTFYYLWGSSRDNNLPSILYGGHTSSGTFFLGHTFTPSTMGVGSFYLDQSSQKNGNSCAEVAQPFPPNIPGWQIPAGQMSAQFYQENPSNPCWPAPIHGSQPHGQQQPHIYDTISYGYQPNGIVLTPQHLRRGMTLAVFLTILLSTYYYIGLGGSS